MPFTSDAIRDATTGASKCAVDPLFEIGPDPTPLELTEVDRQVDSANASFRRAESEYKRAQELGPWESDEGEGEGGDV